MKIFIPVFTLALLASSAYATDPRANQKPFGPQDCPRWQEQQKSLDEMQTLLDKLHADCAKEKELCATRPEIDELRKLHAELKATRERIHERMGNGMHE